MADLILYNANVLTMDNHLPRASMITISSGKIQDVLAKNNYKEYQEKNSVIIDCKGKPVLPGFIDAHFHFNAFLEGFLTLDLSPESHVKSINDIKSRIRGHIADLPPMNWVRAKRYNEFYLEEKRHPNRYDLDEISSSHPIKLSHRSGHAHVLNSLALKLVGISNEISDPPKGLIDRDIHTGEPTGLLYEMGDVLSDRIPPIDPGKMEYAVKQADNQLTSMGITSIQDASCRNDMGQWDAFESYLKKGLLNCRVNMMLGIKGFQAYLDNPFSKQTNPDFLDTGCVKVVLDETTGRLCPSQVELNEIAEMTHERGFQIAIHAIEESAIDSACTAIEYALRKNYRNDHRHRIEHCSVCPPALARRISSLGITVVTQPSFIYYNGERYLETVEDEQMRYLYPFNTLIENKVRTAGSSDCPIVQPSPLIGMYSAITRLCQTGKVLQANERISIREALRLYTKYAAESCFQESIKGTISAGKVADIIMLNDDPTCLSPHEIKDLGVEMTIINGRII